MRLIEQILKETALATDGVEHYGRGAKAYSNIESPKYPRIFIHLVNPQDQVYQNNLITSKYEIIGEVTDLIPFTTDIVNDEEQTEIYLNRLEQLQTIYFKFITNLNKHPKNKSAIGQVMRKEVLHEYDDNLIGYVFTFTMEIIEPVVYQC